MKLKPALYGLLASAALAPNAARAQANFPDTPANHWAYEALSRLKAEGILAGYPDGLYRGGRPLSRYEMAVALNSAYIKIQGKTKELQDQLSALKVIDGAKGIQDSIAAIQDKIDQLKSLGPDIADLKRAADTFELELEQLGVDVEKIRHDLGDLQGRVSKLEAKKPVINIGGDLNFWLGAGTSRNDLYGLNKDGRAEGSSSPSGIATFFPPVPTMAAFDHDSTILHEAAFDFSGTNMKGPQWSATLVETDMFGNFGPKTPTVAFGNQSDVWNLTNGGLANVTGLFGYSEGLEDIYLQKASIEWGGPKVYGEVGRLGFSLSPYLFRRLDTTSYFSNERWDDGQYYMDGAKLGGSYGPAKLTVFGGIDSSVQSLQGVQINPLRSGPIGGIFSPVTTDGGGMNTATGNLTFDRASGADLILTAMKNAHLELGYVVMEGDSTNAYGVDNNTPIDIVSKANRLSVYGADADWKIGQVQLSGGYHESDTQENTQTVIGDDANAWNAKIAYDRGFFGVSAEYRQVGPNYVAAGDWGRLGVLRNPTNIKGLNVDGHIRFLKRFDLKASGIFDAGLLNSYSLTTYLGTGTNIRGYDVRLSYDLSKKCKIYSDLENTHFAGLAAPSSYAGNGDPNYKWWSFGLNYRMSPNAFCNVAYEESDVDNDYQVSGGANFHGGFITSQITYKF